MGGSWGLIFLDNRRSLALGFVKTATCFFAGCVWSSLLVDDAWGGFLSTRTNIVASRSFSCLRIYRWPMENTHAQYRFKAGGAHCSRLARIAAAKAQQVRRCSFHHLANSHCRHAPRRLISTRSCGCISGKKLKSSTARWEKRDNDIKHHLELSKSSAIKRMAGTVNRQCHHGSAP